MYVIYTLPEQLIPLPLPLWHSLGIWLDAWTPEKAKKTSTEDVDQKAKGPSSLEVGCNPSMMASWMLLIQEARERRVRAAYSRPGASIRAQITSQAPLWILQHTPVTIHSLPCCHSCVCVACVIMAHSRGMRNTRGPGMSSEQHQ